MATGERAMGDGNCGQLGVGFIVNCFVIALYSLCIRVTIGPQDNRTKRNKAKQSKCTIRLGATNKN